MATHAYSEMDGRRPRPRALSRAWRRLIDAPRHAAGHRAPRRAAADPRARCRPTRSRSDGPARRPAAEADGPAGGGARARCRTRCCRADRWPLFELRASLLDGGRVAPARQPRPADRRRLEPAASCCASWSRSTTIRTAELPPLALSFRDYVLADAALRGAAPPGGARRQYWHEPPRRRCRRRRSCRWPRARRGARAALRAPPRRAWSRGAGSASRSARRAAGLTPSALAARRLRRGAGALEQQPALHHQPDPVQPPAAPPGGRPAGRRLHLADPAGGRQRAGRRASRERARRAPGSSSGDDLDHAPTSAASGCCASWRAGSGGRAPAHHAGGVHQHLLEPRRRRGPSPRRALGEAELVYSITPDAAGLAGPPGLEDRGGALPINWDAVEELFPAGLLDDMFAAYRRLLARLADERGGLAGAHADRPAPARRAAASRPSTPRRRRLPERSPAHAPFARAGRAPPGRPRR